MSGPLGTRASIYSDLNLVLQIIILVILIIGVKFAKEKTQSGLQKHGKIMTIAVILNAVSLLIVMGPTFFLNFYAFLAEPHFRGYPLTLVHALFGSIAEILGAVFIFKKFGNVRLWMRLTMVVWLIALVFGILFYFRYFVI